MAQLEKIKNGINFNDAEDIYEFAIPDLDLSDVPPGHLQNFKCVINSIACNFQNNCTPFDTSCACIICGETGHDFNGYKYLQDSAKV